MIYTINIWAKVSGKVTHKLFGYWVCTIKIENFYKDVRNDLEAKIDTSDYSDEGINLYNFKRVKKMCRVFFKMSLTVNSWRIL